jgi:hypothetical protein
VHSEEDGNGHDDRNRGVGSNAVGEVQCNRSGDAKPKANDELDQAG